MGYPDVPQPFKPENHETDPQPIPIRDWIRTVDNDSDAVFPTTIKNYFPTWDNFIKHIAVEMPTYAYPMGSAAT